MKKRKTNSHSSNRLLYTFIALGILAIIGVGVYAATYTPSGAGHPYTEISTCGDGQILKMSGGAWTCAADSGGAPETDPTVHRSNYLYRISSACPYIASGSVYEAGVTTTTSTCTTAQRHGSSTCNGGFYWHCTNAPTCTTCSCVQGSVGDTCNNTGLGYLIS